MVNHVFEKAKAFIYRHARPLELARWRFYFENGTREAVLEALAYYQNEDGGFGHALECDCWNPDSAPLQTWMATTILWDIGMTDASHPIIQNTLRYLSSGTHFNGRCWYGSIPSNNDYPHAPWWVCGDGYEHDTSYNPTASLAGFMLYYADKHTQAYQLAARIVAEAAAAYLAQNKPEMHEMRCYQDMIAYCEVAGVTDIEGLAACREKLIRDTVLVVEKDSSVWATTYCCKPSALIKSRNSIYLNDLVTICERECELITSVQQPDGAWPITWHWDAYPGEYAISACWWQSIGVLDNLLFLREFGR